MSITAGNRDLLLIDARNVRASRSVRVIVVLLSLSR
jgi:hypothetical protein